MKLLVILFLLKLYAYINKFFHKYFLQIMTILLAALSIGTKTYFSCSSFKYSITASHFSTGFVLWTFIWCFREMILLSTF